MGVVSDFMISSVEISDVSAPGSIATIREP